MTSPLACERFQADLVALLYEDGDPAERSHARDHLADCSLCRAEYADLKKVRKTLGGWSLPVPAPLYPQRPTTARWIPVGLAAAAGLVLGIGLALAGRSVFSSSSMSQPTLASSAPSPGLQQPQFVSHDQLQNLLTSQEQRIKADIDDLRQSLLVASDPSSRTPGSPQHLVGLSPASLAGALKASEERQARLIESRLASLRSERELQRQYDMAQIAAGLAYIDSRTGADAARTSELMKNLVRVTAKPQDR